MKKSANNCLLRVFVTVVVLLVTASCGKWVDDPKNYHNLNPYSESRNEEYSMIGFSWNGERLIPWADKHLFTVENTVKWNIIEINNENHIIAYAKMVPEDLNNIDKVHTPSIWLLLPYQDVELNKEYSATVYSSVAHLCFNFLLDDNGEHRNVSVPVNVKVVYTYKNKNDKIQGSFTAEGVVLETPDEEPIRVNLKDGVFNLNYHNNFAKYTLGEWLSETKQ